MSKERVTIEFTDEQFEILQKVARLRAQTPEAALRDTVEFYLRLREMLIAAGWTPPADR